MQGFIELPNELKVVLLVFVTVIVTEALKSLGAVFGADLSGYAAQVSSAIVASLVVLANAALSHVPAGLEGIVSALLNLVIVLLGSWGAYKFAKQFKAKG